MEKYYDELLKKLGSSLEQCTSIPFWSWNNELEITELIRQMREFKEQDIDGVIIHARTGLKTEYMGEKWFACVEVCLAEARKSNMQVWIYDENGWPSGFADGKLLRDDCLAQYLEYEIKDSYDESASAVYSLNGGDAKRIFAYEGTNQYHCIYIKNSPSYADILDEKVVSEFLEITHEQYFKRFSNSFGNELVGFFTDEPQYYRNGTAFSRVLPSQFKLRWGEDIMDSLIYLFIDCEKSKSFRHKHFTLLNELFTNVFYKKIYDWCKRHNCKLTGHAVEETKLHSQMWCCAGVMPSYEYEDMPAIDWLGRGIENALSPKQVGSVAQQLGKKQVLTETFGCSGWDTTPRELRWIAEMQYVNGVNTMCQHLSSYSLKGQAKGDYPPSFTRHNEWITKSSQFNTYFKRLSYILSNSAEQAHTLVINPIHSAYTTYDRRSDYQSVQKLDDQLSELVQTLSKMGVQFHIGDELLMKKYAQLSGTKLKLGLCSYDYVVVPSMESIDDSTLKILEQFVMAGGNICFYGEVPHLVNGIAKKITLKSNFSFGDLPNARILVKTDSDKLFINNLLSEYGEFLYIFNSDEEQSANINIGCGSKVLDLENLTISQAKFPYTVDPMQSVMLILQPDSVNEVADKKTVREVTQCFSVSNVSQNCLTVDFVCISKDGINYNSAEFIHSANEWLIKEDYNGKLWIKYIFNATDKVQNAKIMLEQMNYESITLNGKNIELTKSDWDIMFCEADISGNIIKGENQFIVCINYFQRKSVKYILFDPTVMESLKNCIIIDNEIESIYVLGDFMVDDNRKLQNKVNISGINDLQTKGYSNFAGKITISGEVDFVTENAFIKLSGRYMIAEISINGEVQANSILSNVVPLKCLKSGKNKIDITLTSSLRNMMGPHHFLLEPEPKGVGHYCFDMRGTWQNGGCKDFTPQYNLVSFGLDKIEIIEILSHDKLIL